MKEIQAARQVRLMLEKARVRLLRPDLQALHCGAVDVRLAVQCLERVEKGLARPASLPERRALLEEIIGLRRELRRIQALVAAAGKFHAGWASLMAAADESTANYRPAGEASACEPVASSRLVLHG